MDAVTVGQAFIGFDGDDAALPEIHRVLRPSKRLGLIWNMKDESSRLGFRHLTPSHRALSRQRSADLAGNWKNAFERTELFTPLERAPLPSFVHDVDPGPQWSPALRRSASSPHSHCACVSAYRAPESTRARAHAPTGDGGQRRSSRYRYRTGVYWCERTRSGGLAPADDSDAHASPEAKRASASTSSTHPMK